MAEVALWSPERLRTIVKRYIFQHPEMEGIAADKLIEEALREEGHEPTEVLAAVELLREVQWLEKLLAEAGRTRQPSAQTEIPGIPRLSAVKIGEDARGVPVYADGARATIEQHVRQLERDADEVEREAAQRRKEAETARVSANWLKAMGVDTEHTAYEDVPDEIVRQLRERL